MELFNALLASFERYWRETVEPGIAPTLVNLLIFGVVVLLAYRLSLWLRAVAERVVARTRADGSTSLLIGRVVEIGIIALGLVFALSVVGVQIAALVTVIGAFSLAISFATQDVLKNFVAGLYLLGERPFRLGQEIKIKDHIGRVETVGIRTTVLKTADNVQIVVPNSLLFTEIVVNRDAYGGAVVTPKEAEAAPPIPPLSADLSTAPAPPENRATIT